MVSEARNSNLGQYEYASMENPHTFYCTINNERRRVLSRIDWECSPEILRRKKDLTQIHLWQTPYHVFLLLASYR